MKNTKRFMALLLALVLVFSSMTTAFAAVNEDVVDTEFEATVGKLSAIGVMEGYPDGTFRPEGEITRAEFATIAIRALGLGDAANAAVNTMFTDVSATHWAAGYINLAVDRGIIKGYPDGTYRPEGNITNAEAITILVRLVGLGPVIDKHIAAANNEGVLEDVFVASSANATRGNAAKMLMNTIEAVDTWIPDGYNSDGSVEYSRRDGKFLLTENLGIEEVEGRLMSKSTDEVEVGSDTYEYVGDAFDAEYLFLNEVDVWVNDDDEAIYVVKTSAQMFDAVEFGDAEVTLVEADDDYDLNLDDDDDLEIILYVNGSEVDVLGDAKDSLDTDTYSYAKVVLNDKNDVVAIDAYELDDFLVVDEVDEEEVIGLGTDVYVDTEDFTIVKGGMTITLDDLEEGDVFFYNESAEYAEVFNRTESGVIDRVFSESFEIDDEEYDVDLGITRFNDDFDAIAMSDVADMEDAEEAVTLYLNREGELVYIVGELGDAETNDVLAYLTEDAVTDRSFDRDYVELDFVNEMSAEVSVTLRGTDLESYENTTGSAFETAFAAYNEGDVVQLTYDEDGDVTDIELLTNSFTDPVEELETDERYFDGKRLLSDTVVFVIDGDDVEAIAWSDLDFTIDVSASYVNDKDEVIALVSVDANPVSDDTVFGVVDSFRENTDGDVVRITIVNESGETTYNVDEDTDTVAEMDIVELTFEKDSDFVTDVAVVSGAAMEVTATSTTNRTVTAGGTIYRLATGAVVLDGDDDLAKLKVSDIEVGDDIRVIFDEDSAVYVKVVIVNP
jgi:hypothetical protein